MPSLEHGSASRPLSTILEKFLVELQKRINKEQYETWFRGLGLARLDDTEAVFSVPTGFLRDWITRNYVDVVKSALDAAIGSRTGLRVTIVVGTEEQSRTGPVPLNGRPEATEQAAAQTPEKAEPVRPGTTPAAATPPSRHTETPKAEEPVTAPVEPVTVESTQPVRGTLGSECTLNDSYTFEEFVVGPCNRLAHAAALAIGANPGRAYNPFFVHGNVGLGKTHLLQAICHAILRSQPNARVLYLSCEEFTNRFIDSIQNRTLTAFREYHRSADVLVIDDVEFLANKSQTQEEFFHTFNALYNGHKQIVLSSDCKPPEIPTLEERLVSRFKWGLETDMTPPCFETRVAIASRKARMRSVELAPDVLHFLAESVTSNIRELEGAVTKVLGQATITGSPITLQFAEQALRDGSMVRSRQITMSDIMDLITGEFSISAKDLTSKSRTQAISLPRQIGMFLSRQHTDHSLEEVGRFFGNRDHTTVLYAVGKIKKRSVSDRMFHELLSGLSQRLESGNFERGKRSGR